jgi:hypothetical protein
MPYITTETVREVINHCGIQLELSNYHSTWVEDNWYNTKATSSERRKVDDYVSMLWTSLRYVKTLSEINRLMLELLPMSEVSPSLRMIIKNQYYKHHVYPYCDRD